MNYREWEESVPAEIQTDSVWKAKAYRLALFAAELAWHDATKLLSDKRTISLADQLFRAVGGVSADVEEGYSRGTGRDRARFYEYGLGSAREGRGWYYKGRHVLGERVVHHRIELLTEVIRLLLAMVPDQRGAVLREEPPPYNTSPLLSELDLSIVLSDLLSEVPMPEVLSEDSVLPRR
ncbi:MAG: four helix bundle protein [Verrucomicrobia bacterium]|nr:four helix bundle protein [Verrucomicrobiota bacterium]